MTARFQLITPCMEYGPSLKENRPSARMIVANGGVLISEAPEDGNGRMVQRYLIDLDTFEAVI
jgi:hypothetical protein